MTRPVLFILLVLVPAGVAFTAAPRAVSAQIPDSPGVSIPKAPATAASAELHNAAGTDQTSVNDRPLTVPLAPLSPVEAAAVTTSPDEKPTPTATEIEARMKQVAEATDLEEEKRSEALKRLQGAADWLKTASEAEVKIKEYLVEIELAPTELDELKAKLAVPLGEPQLDVSPATALAQLEQAATETETRLGQAREALTKREASLKRRSERKAELTKVIAETDQRLEESRKQLAVPIDEASLLDATRRTEHRARNYALDKQRQLYQIEAQRIDALVDVSPLRRDLAKRDVAYLEKELAVWQKVVAERRKRETERRAVEARQMVHDAHPALKQMAQQIATLAERHKTLVADVETTQKEVQANQKLAKRLGTDFEKLAEKVDKVGHSTSIGMLLRRQREELPDVGRCQERMRYVRDKMPQMHLALLDLQEDREALGDPEAAVAAVIAALDGALQQFDLAYVEQMVGELLQSKRDLLDKLIRDHDDFVKLLVELELTHQDLVDLTEQCAAFIDERVLWIRSSEPLGRGDFASAWNGFQEMTGPPQWILVGQSAAAYAVRHPAVLAIAALFALLLLIGKGRIRRRLTSICHGNDEVGTTRFFPTLEALLKLTLATAFWPLLIWLIGWQMTVATPMPELGRAVGCGLQKVALLLWILHSARQLCRRDGLAERHFQWNAQSLAIIRRQLVWFIPFGACVVFLLVFIDSYRDGEWSASLGRLATLAAYLGLAVFCHFLLRPARGMFGAPCSSQAAAWFCRIRPGIYLAGVAIPVALAALVALGYDYSAQRLAFRLQATLAAGMGVTVCAAVADRWLAIRSRLASKATADQSRDALAHDQGTLPVAANAKPTVEEEQTECQLRYLLRYAVALSVCCGIYWIWSDVSPALSVLDRVELWSKTVDVKEEVEDVDGNLVVRSSQRQVATTLKHAVLAGAVLMLSLIIARNLPGLLRVLILERMPIDNGQRYAAGMVMRYLVSLAGVIAACRIIGLTWGSIQWLAAAMTVGLGFGLQEIFANLVSGLIILFERPIRVDDLVTVGGVTGRVTRMQIRATTITDFDRKELIVPNKKFITEDVMNWTLSDHINRLVIEVGVAYGSDIALAREILLQVAWRHPLVLSEPAPSAVFDRFANSSLNLTLRCFLPNLDNRLAVIHELHAAIDVEFRKAHIEIAFPQQDLHLRSIDVPLEKLLPLSPRKEAA